MANTSDLVERNVEATMILRAYLSKEDPALVKASLNDLVEILRARYQAASDINSERAHEVRKLQLSLGNFG